MPLALPARPAGLGAGPFVVAPRFCGPPGAGNGGYVAGQLVARAGLRGPVEVTLRRPAPLGAALYVLPAGSGVWGLEDGAGERIAEARRDEDAFAEAPPALPDLAEIAALRASESAHPFPSCFVCGPARAPGDGLRILPAPVPGTRIAAALWTPTADLAGPGGFVALPIVWAALDCPGYFGTILAGPRVPLLLGRMTAAVTGPVRAGARLRALGWALARDGRRHAAATALVDESDAVVARSRQVWIAPRPDS